MPIPRNFIKAFNTDRDPRIRFWDEVKVRSLTGYRCVCCGEFNHRVERTYCHGCGERGWALNYIHTGLTLVNRRTVRLHNR